MQHEVTSFLPSSHIHSDIMEYAWLVCFFFILNDCNMCNGWWSQACIVDSQVLLALETVI